MTTINGKIENAIKNDIKFIILLGSVIISIIVPYFYTRETIITNQQRIEVIEQARAEAWTRQEKMNEKTTDCINRMNETLIKMNAF